MTPDPRDTAEFDQSGTCVKSGIVYRDDKPVFVNTESDRAAISANASKTAEPPETFRLTDSDKAVAEERRKPKSTGTTNPEVKEKVAKMLTEDDAEKPAKPTGKGRLSPTDRVRSSSAGGTTVRVPKKPAKPKPATKRSAVTTPKKEKKMSATATKTKTVPAKKAEKPANPKRSDVTPKTELRKMQLRALKVLNDGGIRNATNGLSLEQLAKSAKISTVVMRRGLGATHPDNREDHDAREGFKSLLSRGLVKVGVDGERGTVYYLGPLGEKKVGTEDLSPSALGPVHAKPFSIDTNGKRAAKKAKKAATA